MCSCWRLERKGRARRRARINHEPSVHLPRLAGTLEPGERTGFWSAVTRQRFPCIGELSPMSITTSDAKKLRPVAALQISRLF
jgi:hypothetical protein